MLRGHIARHHGLLPLRPIASHRLYQNKLLQLHRPHAIQMRRRPDRRLRHAAAPNWRRRRHSHHRLHRHGSRLHHRHLVLARRAASCDAHLPIREASPPPSLCVRLAAALSHMYPSRHHTERIPLAARSPPQAAAAASPRPPRLLARSLISSKAAPPILQAQTPKRIVRHRRRRRLQKALPPMSAPSPRVRPTATFSSSSLGGM